MERPKYEAVQQGSELHSKDGDGDDQEEIDIDLEDPKVKAAATKMQAIFNRRKARKEIQSKKDASAENSKLNENNAVASEKDGKVATKSETLDKEEIDIRMRLLLQRYKPASRGARPGKDKKDDAGRRKIPMLDRILGWW